MITAAQIDEIAEQVNDYTSNQIQVIFNQIYKRQPALYNYLFSKDTTIFNQQEKELLYYVVLVIWQTMAKLLTIPQRIAAKKIDTIQDANWKVIENLPNRLSTQSLEMFLDSFFDNHPQEELVGLIIDMLDESEETEKVLTKESIIPIFVLLKTMVDSLVKK